MPRTEKDALNMCLEPTKKVPGVMWTIGIQNQHNYLPDKNRFLPKTYWYTELHRLFQQSSNRNTQAHT